MEEKSVSRDALWMGQKEAEQCALHRVEHDLDACFGQQEGAPAFSGDNAMYVARPFHILFTKVCRKCGNS